MSLPHSRRHNALSEREIEHLSLEFSALGASGCELAFEAENGTRTRFCLKEGQPTIIVGADVFPGRQYASGNASLDPLPALAHEATHYDRWRSGREIPHGVLTSIDEAVTSLQAIIRYRSVLNDFHREQLVHDALERLESFLQQHPDLGGEE